MQVTPVEHYPGPSFPTRLVIDENPELLKLVPRRWQANPTVLAALAGLSVLMAGARTVEADETKAAAPRVAPLFDHGEGQGSFGCIATNPPVFLSEEEARKVIIEEAKRAGIQFAEDSLKLDSVRVPITDRYGFLEKRESKADPDNAKVNLTPNFQMERLTLDGTDAKRSISFEFVSGDDFGAWEKRPQTRMCTVSQYDMRGTAAQLRDSLELRRSPGAFVVFYDPCVGPRDVEKQLDDKIDYRALRTEAGYQEFKKKASQISREELRKQVQDFVKWLKAQGAI